MRRWVLFLLASLTFGLLRCSADSIDFEPGDAGFDRPFPNEEGGLDADTTPPTAITDLAIGGVEHDAITLTWTAPAGTFAYQIRYATTAIQGLPDFQAATSVPSQIPKTGGQLETMRITGLTPDTMYWFAIRARDNANNLSELSNVASGTTKPRAAFVVSEIAPLNNAATGMDFVEIVATKAGSARGIEIRQTSTTIAPLHTLADIEVAVGTRFVIHTTGLPGPPGFQQEDATKNMASSTATVTPDAGPPVVIHSVDAFDVYSAETGLTGTDNVITIVDNGATTDAVAFSERDGTASTLAMTAFAKARTDSQWTFTAAPVDETNDCDTQLETVSISDFDSICGGFVSGVAPGVSINRNGTTDTNTKRDFYVAAHTPGQPNGVALATPTLLSAATTGATGVEVRFSQEILGTSAPAASFTINGGLNVTAASVRANKVTLTTDAQSAGAPYVVTVAGTVTNYHAVALTGGLTARFCGFSAVPAVLQINEVAPNITGADLVELRVLGGGGLAGFTLFLNRETATSGGSTLATLPSICAAVDDLVVVHLQPVAGAVSETVTKDEVPVATVPANYDAAWDVQGTSTGIPFTNATLAIRAPGVAGAYQDSAVFTRDLENFAAGTLTSLLFFQNPANAFWLPADCSGAACDATTARTVGANWATVGNSAITNTIARTNAAKQASSWVVGASSFGLPNP